MIARDCFESRLAVYPTRIAAVTEIIDPLAVTHAAEVIDRYRDAMRDGARFPPISVVRLGGRSFVADGHKRFTAYRQLGGREIVVEQWPWHRWLRDQLAQLARSSRVHVRLLARAIVDRRARRDLRHQAIVTLGHWRRIALSLRDARPW